TEVGRLTMLIDERSRRKRLRQQQIADGLGLCGHYLTQLLVEHLVLEFACKGAAVLQQALWPQKDAGPAVVRRVNLEMTAVAEFVGGLLDRAEPVDGGVELNLNRVRGAHDRARLRCPIRR